MTTQKNTSQDQRVQQTSSKRKPRSGGQQQAYSSQQGQQGSFRGDNRIFDERNRQQASGVERAQRSLADRERDEADGGAPDDVLPKQQPSGWTTRDV